MAPVVRIADKAVRILFYHGKGAYLLTMFALLIKAKVNCFFRS
jgi:hypothetical protein